MVRIPQPQQGGQQVGTVQLDPAATPFIQARAADTTAPGRDLQRIGQTMGQLAGTLQQQYNDNMLRKAEVEYMQFERQLLDPQTGIYAQRGGNAVGTTQLVTERLAEFRSGVTQRYGDGLSVSGKQALERYLDGAEQRMWSRAATYETDQQRQHTDDLMGAQIEGAMDRAALLYNDPTEVASAALYVETLAGDLANHRGLTGLARDQFIEDEKTKLYLTVADQMLARGDATGAASMIQGLLAGGQIDATSAQAALAKLRPHVVDEEGRRYGAALAEVDATGRVVVAKPGSSPYVDAAGATPPAGAAAAPPGGFGVSVTPGAAPLFSMQGASSMTSPAAVANMDAVLRGPYQELQNALGFPITINDAIARHGTSRERETPGSQHFHGRALDVDTSKHDSTTQLMIINEALKSGFRGIGLGAGYLHIDTRGTHTSWLYGAPSYAGIPGAVVQQWIMNYGNDPVPKDPRLAAVIAKLDTMAPGRNAMAAGGKGGVITSEPLIGSLPVSQIAGAIDAAANDGVPVPEGATVFTSSDDLLASITDPEIRAAAISEMATLRKAQDAAFLSEQTRLTNAIYADMERAFTSGETYDLDAALRQPGVLDALGDNVKGIREYHSKRKAGEDIVTDPGLIDTLRKAAAQDPELFAQTDLVTMRATGRLSDKHFEELSKAQAAILEKAAGGMTYTPSDLATLLQSATRGMDPEARGRIETQVYDYVTAYRTENKRAPTETDIVAFGRWLASSDASATFNPAGFWAGATRGPLREILQAVEGRPVGDLIEADMLTLPVPMADGSERQVTFTGAQIEDAIQLFLPKDENGIPLKGSLAPTPGELITLLILLESDRL